MNVKHNSTYKPMRRSRYWKRVVAGAKAMDERVNDNWWDKIDLDVLKLENSTACVLGQTVGFFDAQRGTPVYDKDGCLVDRTKPLFTNQETYELGFNLDTHESRYKQSQQKWDALTNAWKQLIKERQEGETI